MQYDFTTLMHREGQDALALDSLGKNPGFAPDPPKEGFDVIPMWVADMNFPVLHTIPDAIAARLKQPHFGYFTPGMSTMTPSSGGTRPATGSRT